jgi:RNA polymerase sigma factor (sigma-70 family)
VARPDDAGLLARLDAAAVGRAMEDLSTMQRACFELTAVRDLSVEQVAAMHGISESTVRQHVFRARAALRQALDGFNSTPGTPAQRSIVDTRHNEHG